MHIVLKNQFKRKSIIIITIINSSLRPFRDPLISPGLRINQTSGMGSFEFLLTKNKFTNKCLLFSAFTDREKHYLFYVNLFSHELPEFKLIKPILVERGRVETAK